jgi:hypothetical protein
LKIRLAGTSLHGNIVRRRPVSRDTAKSFDPTPRNEEKTMEGLVVKGGLPDLIASGRRVARLGAGCVALTALVACSAGYVARLNPPSPDGFESAVDFAKAYTGGNERTTDGVREMAGHMCGMEGVPGAAPRRQLYLTGMSKICARKGGTYASPFCLEPDQQTVIFMASARNSPKRTCNSDLDDFLVYAAEPIGATDRRAFTAWAEQKGHVPPAKLAAIERERAAARAATQKRLAEEQAAAAAEERQRLTAAAIDFRKTIRVGTQTNCGPVIEVRGDLAKVYFPVQNFGNEHWIEIYRLYPPSARCQFHNGQYVPPL